MELRAHYNQHGELTHLSVDAELPEIRVPVKLLADLGRSPLDDLQAEGGTYRFLRLESPDMAVFERVR